MEIGQKVRMEGICSWTMMGEAKTKGCDISPEDYKQVVPISPKILLCDRWKACASWPIIENTKLSTMLRYEK